MRVRFSNAAEADIAAINREGIRLFGERQAKAYAAGLSQAFQLIGDYPLASPERDYLAHKVRMRSYGSHVILYVVEDAGVGILRIRHGREDWLEA